MARIVRAELTMVDLKPMTQRTDAIQSFVSQETPILTLTDDEGHVGTGYTYTIGSGGSSIVALMRDHLLPRVIGMDTDTLEANWRSLLFGMHALAVGPISSLALAAIDIAFWDLRCVRTGIPLHRAVGGAHDRMPRLHNRGRLAAPVCRAARRRRGPNAGAWLSGREAEDRQAPSYGGS